jgi:hypothetical protein
VEVALEVTTHLVEHALSDNRSEASLLRRHFSDSSCTRCAIRFMSSRAGAGPPHALSVQNRLVRELDTSFAIRVPWQRMDRNSTQLRH